MSAAASYSMQVFERSRALLTQCDYCSDVWQECSQCLRQKLERVQNYGMRIILSRPPRTHSDDLCKELAELDNIRGSKEHEQVVPSV